MIAALLLLAQITPAPAEPKPIVTTIAAIRANAKKFDGQIVRIHGYVNECMPRGCLIEERSANSPGGAGAFLSIGTDTKFDATIKRLIPTYVEFDARFDASCLTGDRGGVITVCADRAPELSIVQLRAVVSPEPPPFEKP
jgi:hypothetical protein